MQHDADAYYVEHDDGERAIVDGYDWTGWETGHTTLAALECLRSYDHGARTAEELDMDRCADGAAYIMSPMLALMLPAGAPWHPGLAHELANAYIVENYHVEPALHDVGYVVESSGDAGMTWVYRPMEEER